MASFCLKGDAVLRWIGIFSHDEILRYNPRFVQVTILSDFQNGKAMSAETIWVRVTLMGKDKIYGAIANIPSYGDSHGLCFDDPITVDAGNVIQIRLK